MRQDMECFNVTTNVNGIPYLSTSTVTVTDTAASFALGFRRIQPVGYFTIRVENPIPDGTTTTLPVNVTLNGTTRPLTYFNGDPVTVADVTGTGILLVFNDRFNGILQLMSPASAA